MSEMMKCENCGASLQEGWHACAYCGAMIARPPEPAPPPPPPSPNEVRAERFRRLKGHVSYERLLRYTPSSSGPAAGLIIQGVFGLVFAGVAGFMAYNVATSFAPGFMAMLPVLFVVVGLGIAGSAVVRFMRFEEAPVRAFPARIATKDMQVSRSNNSTSTTYYVTLEEEHHARHSYAVPHALYSTHAEDDIGVAHVRDTFLLNFVKVDV